MPNPLIEKLKTHEEESPLYVDTIIETYPNEKEMFDKINEIIEVVNNLNKKE